MKEINEIDQLFEESLHGLTVEPSTQSWDKITSGLEAATANAVASQSTVGGTRKYLLWSLLGSVSAILAVIFFFNQNQNKTDYSKQSLSQHQEQIISPSQNTNDIISTNKTNPKDAVVNSSSEIEQNILQPKQTVNHSVEYQVESTSNDHIPYTVAEHKIIKTQHLSENSASKKSEKESSKIAKGTNHITDPEIAQKPNSTQVEAQNIKPVEEEQVAENINSQETEIAPTSVVSEAIETPVAEVMTVSLVSEVEEAPKTETSPDIENIAETEAEKSSNIDATKTEEATSPVIATSSSPTETTGIRFATGWSMDLYGGPAWILNNESETFEEKQPISQTGLEEVILTPSIGLNLKYHINHWFIQGGVSYAEYGENKNYTQQFELHDTTGFSKENIDDYYSYDSVGYYIDPNNPNIIITLYDAIKHYDTSYSWVAEDSLYYEHQTIYAQNRFRYIEIPVMVGYEFRIKNLSVELSTGVSIGFRVNSSGKFLDSQNNLIDINSSNSPYSNTMMNYLLSVGLKYHIDNRFSVIAQPIYKTNLNSLFNSGNSARYNHIGLNIGLNYIIK